MANMVRGFLASLCGCSEVVVDIPMEEIDGGGDNAVQVVVPSCFDRMEEVWHGWNCATKVCVAATGAIMIVGSMMSIGGLCSLALGGAVMLPTVKTASVTLTTASTTVTTASTTVTTVSTKSIVVEKEVEFESIEQRTLSGNVIECTINKQDQSIKLGKFQGENVKNFYMSLVDPQCINFFNKANSEFMKNSYKNYGIAFEVKKQDYSDKGFRGNNDIRKFTTYEENGNKGCTYSLEESNDRLKGAIEEAIKQCRM